MAASIPTTVIPSAPFGGATSPTLQAANGGGDTMVPGPNSILVVKNADSASHTVTVTRVAPCSDGTSTPTHDIVVAVAAGTTANISVDSRYGRLSDGLAAVTYSAATSVTVGVLQAP